LKKKSIRVAIIGGGCAGITTAFELSHAKHEGRYDVTVYQMGWRLGGKGASGRGPADRIEEHGLHLWMGFYENAFQLMRECYRELGRDAKHHVMADWTDAFVPDPCCGVMDYSPDGEWSPWTVVFPPMPGLPGDPGMKEVRWTVTEYLLRSLRLVRTLLEAIQTASQTAMDPKAVPHPPVGTAPGELTRIMSILMGVGGIVGLGGLIYGLRVLDEAVRLMPRFPREMILAFHKMLANSAREQLEQLTQRDTRLRRLWEVADLVLATIHGIVSHRLITDPRGFDAIDDHDCREWLIENGASERSANGAFLRALYDLAFAYEDGDVTRPGIAAGQALRGAVRAFFTYRGAFFWKMQAGMGDVVFAPFCEVLSRRGVRFEFFHRLTNVGIEEASPGYRPRVSSLDFEVQAKLKAASYQPLVDVKGLACWPSEPDWNQLQDGARLRREGRSFESHWDRRREGTTTLNVGKDFDFVVLAVGVGALPYVCPELIARDPRWRDQVQRVKSVPTQALQVWLNEDAQALGWRGPSVNISGYVEPFDTWADMPQLIDRESLPHPVRTIAYFCSVLKDARSSEEHEGSDYPQRRNQEVRKNAIEFLKRDVQAFWPNSVDEAGRFRWQLLVGTDRKAPRKADESAIDSQYFRANVEPSDRYSLSLPGTLRYRISPLDQTYENLTVAGDWTDCGFNEGCVEAAVMSGRLAAHALSQLPPLEEIIGFDHP
jgi:uncharacterized protein with NAD-binding domain and iron-sulfur cluster